MVTNMLSGANTRANRTSGRAIAGVVLVVAVVEAVSTFLRHRLPGRAGQTTVAAHPEAVPTRRLAAGNVPGQLVGLPVAVVIQAVADFFTRTYGALTGGTAVVVTVKEASATLTNS